MRRLQIRTAAVLAGGVLFLVAGSALSAGIEDGDLEVGRQKYNTLCVSCHGEKGDGQGPVGKTLNPPPRDFTKADFKYGGTDKDIFDVISNGAASKGGSPLMAPWGAIVSEKERWGLVKYVRSLKKK
jgi:mono/diheme cytochrome c family protein